VNTISEKNYKHLDKIKSKFGQLNSKIDEKYVKCKEEIEKHFEDKLNKNEMDAFKKYERWVRFI
jgi:hypothetical protein